MVVNLHGKKVQTHQDDEVRYIFTVIILKNILLWTSFGKEEKARANKTRLVGLFEVEWKTYYHNILVEFLNNWKLDANYNKSRLCWGKSR
jgi:hypothetical protein